VSRFIDSRLQNMQRYRKMQSFPLCVFFAVVMTLLSEVTQGHPLSQILSRIKRDRVDEFDYGLSSADIRAIMEVHTQQREDAVPSAANMQFMTWNTVLANTAQNYACRCGPDPMEHNSQRVEQSPGFDTVGESMFAKTGSWREGEQPAGGVTHWFSEVDAFTFISGEQGTCSGPCGHYKQGVWHDSVEIGCGYAQCGPELDFGIDTNLDRHLLVCNYAPGGNTNGQPPYDDGAPCSNCPDGWNGGCAYSQCTRDGGRCGDILCSNGGTLDADMCLCDCRGGFYGAFCEQTQEHFDAICTDDNSSATSSNEDDDENPADGNSNASDDGSYIFTSTNSNPDDRILRVSVICQEN